MAKRLTDTEKWKKPFIRSLSQTQKLLWLYILDDCDHAGIWQADFEVASIRIGAKVTEKMMESFGDRVENFAPGKYFISDFIDFHYGVLTDKNRLHVSVLQILEKNKIKGLVSPLEGVKYNNIYKRKDINNKEGGVGETILTSVGEINVTENWDQIKLNFLNDWKWQEKFCRDKKIGLVALQEKMMEFINDLELKEDYKDLTELKSHFTNLYNKNNGTHKQTSVKGGRSGTSADRVEALKRL